MAAQSAMPVSLCGLDLIYSRGDSIIADEGDDRGSDASDLREVHLLHVPGGHDNANVLDSSESEAI